MGQGLREPGPPHDGGGQPHARQRPQAHGVLREQLPHHAATNPRRLRRPAREARRRRVGGRLRHEGLEDGFDDDDAEEFEAGGKVRVDLRDVDALRLGQDLDFDIQVLRALLTYADAVTPERDAKLVKLRDFIAGKVSEPYNPGNRKVLVFSAFADTTAYLFEQLAPWLKRELGIECAEVAGSSNRTYSLKLPRTTFENILARFSPVSCVIPNCVRR